MNADQKEISIQDGVSEYLNARPWAIRKVKIDGLRPGESNLSGGAGMTPQPFAQQCSYNILEPLGGK